METLEFSKQNFPWIFCFTSLLFLGVAQETEERKYLRYT